ncbi:MAG TPA: DUF4129 domain-containing protein [Candidatus Limnocylindrales bacterium]
MTPIPARSETGAARSDRVTRAATTIVGLVPVALVVIAEAAWISVVGGLLQEFAFREPVLDIPATAAFVVVGIVAARLLGRRFGGRWPIVALAVVVAAGTVGWLASPSARGALGDGLGPAIAAHPGGWMAGLAVLRGFAHARLPLVEDTVARLLGLGVPGLAISAIVGGVIDEPFRGRFLADALGASIVFVVAATLALALTRMTAVGSDAGFDWRRNPTWLGLTVGLLVVAIVAAVPLSVVAGTAIEAVFAIAVGPLLLAGLLTGLDRTVRRVLGLILVVGVILLVVIQIFAGSATNPPPPPGVAAGQGRPAVADQVMTMSIGGLLLIAAVIAILVLAAVWMQRTQPPEEDLVEESRTIDRGDGGAPRLRRRRLFGRRPEPADAVAAYVALVRDLDGHPEVRRGAAETPAEHAARLRSDGRAALSLDLLAADYALDRYGGVMLPDRENRRAIGRWRVLRRRLPRDPGHSGPST